MAERVADYRIVAPTEWNFHATGSVADGLAHPFAPWAAPGPDGSVRFGLAFRY